MKVPYRLKNTLGASYNSDPDDVWVTKNNLHIVGYYQKKNSINEYPDRELFDSIKKYQRANNLRVDGIMKPDGETERHILNGDKVAMSYWCRVCGAPHGGVYSPIICWQCWNKGLR
jgi:hypothetical protein